MSYSTEQIANIATIFSTGLGLFVFVFVIFQYRQFRTVHHDNAARHAILEYLKLAIEHPDLAFPNYDDISLEPQKLEKYEWFVSYLLRTCEEILASQRAGSKYEWADTVELQVGYHKKYLQTTYKDKKYSRIAGKRLRKILRKVIAS